MHVFFLPEFLFRDELPAILDDEALCVGVHALTKGVVGRSGGVGIEGDVGDGCQLFGCLRIELIVVELDRIACVGVEEDEEEVVDAGAFSNDFREVEGDIIKLAIVELAYT